MIPLTVVSIPESMKQMIAEVKGKLQHRPKLASMFENCFENTWKTTIKRQPDGTTFVITGDIPAMWLRDSAAQVRPYLILAERDTEVSDMIKGLVDRQMQFIIQDPYANAFNESSNGEGHQSDLTAMDPAIWERKYEIDSLCYPIQLSYLLWKATGRTDHFDLSYFRAIQMIIDLWIREQQHESKSSYSFERFNNVPTDTLTRDGKGSRVAETGMTWSGFRPSDDSCTYGYLVPSNMFAVVVLRYIAEIVDAMNSDASDSNASDSNASLKQQAILLAAEIKAGIGNHAIVDHAEFGRIYAYETDGLGNYNLSDDANVPSLLSIPYLGYTASDDPIYANTRRFILSESNPYFYKGKSAEGIGSPHTPKRYIWHISLAMQGLTSNDISEKERILSLLESTDADTLFMHEAFDVDDPSHFTREWFSWANMMFCELVLDYCGTHVRIDG